MQKEHDITRHGLYDSDENNRGITMQKRWWQWTHASGECCSGAHFSILPDFFHQKNQDNPIGRSEGMGPKPYCSNNMDGCDKRKKKKKREEWKKCPKEQTLRKKNESVRRAEGMWKGNKREREGYLQQRNHRFLWLANTMPEKRKTETPKNCSRSGIKAHMWVVLVCLGANEK